MIAYPRSSARRVTPAICQPVSPYWLSSLAASPPLFRTKYSGSYFNRTWNSYRIVVRLRDVSRGVWGSDL